MNAIKVVKIVLTIAGLGVSFAQTLMADKENMKIIEEKVAKEVAKQLGKK